MAHTVFSNFFSARSEFSKKSPRVPRYCCRAPVAKKTACSNAHRFRNLTANSRSISSYISACGRGTVTAFLVQLAVSIGYTIL